MQENYHNKNAFAKAARIITNVVTDVGVMAQSGNTGLNWSGGKLAITFNLGALALCAGLRLRVELAKDKQKLDSPTQLQKIFDNPNLSLMGAGAAQFVAAAAVGMHMSPQHLQTIVDTAIPSCFAVGDMLVVVGAANAKSAVTRIALNPFNYFVAGLAMAGSAVVPGAFFAGAAALSNYKTLSNNQVGPDPFYLMAAGSEFAAASNGSNPVLMLSLTAFTVAWLSVKAGIECGGVYQALQSTPGFLRRNLSKISLLRPR